MRPPRRRSGSRKALLASIAVFVALMVAAGWLLQPYLREGRRSPAAAPGHGDVAARGSQHASDAGRPGDLTEGLRPTHGPPIDLRMIPSGARLLVHLRPARLWSDEPRMAELRGSLTQDVADWIETGLTDLTHRSPEKIEQVLLAWILGARGTDPQMCAVVHLAEEERLSALIDEFGGEPLDEFAQPKVYLRERDAVMIRDTRTLAFCPRELGEELAEWASEPNPHTSDSILAVLSHTDQDRLVTVVCEPADLERHLDVLADEPVRPALLAVCGWLADRAEAVSWSVHQGDVCHFELLLRGPVTTTSADQEQALQQRLFQLPRDLVRFVRQMNPQRSGFRKIIGRFPAMVEVCRRATRVQTDGHRLTQLITVLPPQALPNLALGTVLTWDESTRLPSATGSSDAEILAAGQRGAPRTLAERLRQPVDGEFSRTPLQEAIDYLAGELDVPFKMDGDALKDAGFTKNMPQSMNLGRVPAIDILREIVLQYKEPGKELVIVVDEAAGRVTVTTRKFAEQQGQTPWSF
jgi:hypothetical protein